MPEQLPVDPNRMKVDIRARMLWGDDLDSIRAEWQKKGASDVQITEALRAAEDECRGHFRRRGLQDILIGAAALSLAAWLAYALLHGARIGRLIVLVYVCPIVGLYFAIRGIRRVIRGGEDGEAASDLDEFESFGGC